MEKSSKQFIRSREKIEKILRKETMGFLGMCKDGMPSDSKQIRKEEVLNCYAVEISISDITGRVQRNGLGDTYFEYNFR